MADPTVLTDPSRLRADCARCVGLCCVAPGFARSADFALDKPAGVACPHLSATPGQFGCTIHDELRPRGFAGCTTYDCFGAGQHVVQHTYGGGTWRDGPDTAAEMFGVFHVARPLHELLWLLAAACALPAAAEVRGELVGATSRLEQLLDAPPAALAAVDVDAERAAVVPLLRRASALARPAGPDLAGADLAGQRLHDLRGASLRGALLLGADLRVADLRLADVTGADLRGADVRGTDLRDVLFLTQMQANATLGDAGTRLPPGLQRPAHWGVSEVAP